MASFFSPCTIPLLPSYLSFVTGVSLQEADQKLPAGRRMSLILNSLFFIIGFSLIFIALGALAPWLGRNLRVYQIWVERVGGVIIILLGIHLMGLLKVAALQRDTRLQLQDRPVGYLGAVVIGAAFAAGWTPCAGPFLVVVLGLASQLETVWQGVGLLAVYSAGLALPFVAAALLMGEALLRLIGRASRHVRTVSVVAGALLVAFGVLLVLGKMGWFFGAVQRLMPLPGVPPMG